MAKSPSLTLENGLTPYFLGRIWIIEARKADII